MKCGQRHANGRHLASLGWRMSSGSAWRRQCCTRSLLSRPQTTGIEKEEVRLTDLPDVVAPHSEPRTGKLARSLERVSVAVGLTRVIKPTFCPRKLSVPRSSSGVYPPAGSASLSMPSTAQPSTSTMFRMSASSRVITSATRLRWLLRWRK